MGRTVRRMIITAALVMTLVGIASPANAALTLRAAWNMGTQPVLVDSNNGDNNGTAYDVKVVSGAYVFNGTTSYATAPDAANLDPGAATIKVTARINFTRPLDVGQTYDIVRKGLSTTAGGYYKIEIKKLSSGASVASCRFKGSTAGWVNGTVELAGKGWVTIVCTKTASQVKLNAAGQTVTKNTAVGSIGNDSPVVIGAKGDGTDSFPGMMDYIKIAIG